MYFHSYGNLKRAIHRNREYDDDCQGWWAGEKERQWSKIIEVRTKSEKLSTISDT